jgi:hypothetical protein
MSYAAPLELRRTLRGEGGGVKCTNVPKIMSQIVLGEGRGGEDPVMCVAVE